MRALFLAVLLPVAALAEPLIDRPLNVRAGSAEVGLMANTSSWDVEGTTISGQTAAVELAYGITSGVQLGVAVVAPINPQFAFGSALLSGVFAASSAVSIRADAGYEQLSNAPVFKGDLTEKDFYFGGVGVPLKARLGPHVAFVSGGADPVRFAHFTNLGDNGNGFYVGGATAFSASDLVSVAYNHQGGSGTTYLNVTLPAGLLFQVAEPFAVTLLSGFHEQILIQGNTESTSQYFPLGIEAVLTVARGFDAGVSFGVAGEVGAPDVSYFAVRNAAVWLRLRSL
jgi:hypothetical protein